MKATQLLHDLGQSLWVDNITRDLVSTGTLARSKSFVASWNELMAVIESKSSAR